MIEPDVAQAQAALKHVKRLLGEAKPPELPPELAELSDLADLHAYLVTLRNVLGDFADGEFTRHIDLRGFMAGKIKAYQANIMHLIWQVRQVAKGDFTQSVEFLGDLSDAFNSMVKQLDGAREELRRKEEELTRMTSMLRHEVEMRGLALEKLSASEARFKYLADHDPLTGVLNRRSFFGLAELELAKASERGESCCVALLDIDHFKRFNDAHGHLEGDAAIRRVIVTSQETLRHNDLVGRYGGEEFVYLFSRAGKDQGFHAAERMRLSIENHPLRIGGKDVVVTVSIGLVEVPPGQYSPEENRFLAFVLNTADSALYEAKRGGRNRTRVAQLGDLGDWKDSRRKSVRV